MTACPCKIKLTRRAPNRWHARVDCCVDVLTGGTDDMLGASAEGESASEAIEGASEKIIALMASNPELATALLPIVGPEISSLIIAARYLDAPEIVRDIVKEAIPVAKETARQISHAVKTAEKTGRAAVTIGKKAARAAKSIGKKLKFW